MHSILPQAQRIELDVTDDRLTDHGGLAFLSIAARRLGVFELLGRFLPCKRRRRGASDAENLWALVGNLACGDGTLQDQDRLKGNRANRVLLGLATVAGSRRMGEWLGRLTRRHVDSLRGLATQLAKRIAPVIMKAELALRGYIPVFIDGTAIEVKGKHFEGANTLYTRERGLWLYATFIGSLQVSSRLCAAVSDAAGDWYQQLKRDVVSLIPDGAPVWVAVDNAYFRWQFVRYITSLGWDFSISVTDSRVKRKIIELLTPDTDWLPLPDEEDVYVCNTRYQPTGWDKGYRCIVIRRWVTRDGTTDLFPTHTVVMTSSNRATHLDVLHRHWQKQGFENGFKGPLREMNLHHPPTAALGGNQIYYLCALIAQMLLTYLQYTALPTAAQDVGLRPLIRDIMRSVAKLTRSGGRYRLLFSKDHSRFAWLIAAMNQTDDWWVTAPG